jgi:hypothetical protein
MMYRTGRATPRLRSACAAPASLRRYLAARVVAAGALTALIAAGTVYFYAHKNTDLVTGYSLDWPGNEATVCYYDAEAEVMTVTVRLTGHADADVDLHIGVGVGSNDDSNTQEYRADHTVHVDEGRFRQPESIAVDLPADTYADGFTDCFLAMGDIDRAEPWD